ncbi:MAG: hypothetical protein KJT03_17710, partial [Verrucomicrobiae bacterium]|nr:hypothetical protein [Verrucomicrobiae bacterium]
KGQRYENVSRNESDQWLSGQEALMDTLHNHPSIIKWIIFNEAWGQHDTERILNWTKKKDTSRILSIASGWDDLPGESEVRDLHDYTFYPAIPAFVTNPNRVVVFGECGGFAGAVPPHNWTGRSNQTGKPENILFGGFDPSVPRDDNRVHDILRATFNFGKPFETQYSQFVDSLVLLKNQGLGAAVYTQMTDMKLEENGWLTFDREVSKIDVNALKAIHDRLYQDPPNQKAFLQGDWKYRLGEHLADHWVKPGFDDTGWDSGNAPFGFNSILKTDTEWRGGNFRLRKTFTVDSIPDRLSLRVTTYLDGPNRVETVYTKIYLNGEFIQDDQTRQFIPEQRVAEIPLWPETLANLKQGENLIAVEVIPGFSFRSGKVAGEGPRNGLAFDIQLMEIEE